MVLAREGSGVWLRLSAKGFAEVEGGGERVGEERVLFKEGLGMGSGEENLKGSEGEGGREKLG